MKVRIGIDKVAKCTNVFLNRKGERNAANTKTFEQDSTSYSFLVDGHAGYTTVVRQGLTPDNVEINDIVLLKGMKLVKSEISRGWDTTPISCTIPTSMVVVGKFNPEAASPELAVAWNPGVTPDYTAIEDELNG